MTVMGPAVGSAILRSHLKMSEPVDDGLEFGPNALELPFEPRKNADFTCFIDAAQFRERLQQCLKDPSIADPRIAKRKSFDFEHLLNLGGHRCTARVHAALCYDNRLFSVTLRSLQPKGSSAGLTPELGDWAALCEARPRYLFEPPAHKPAEFLLPIASAATILCDQIFADASNTFAPGHGLVLIAGGTGSGKTTYLGALLYRYLERLFAAPQNLERPPHVVAIGDPVETNVLRKGDTGSELEFMKFLTDGTAKVNYTKRVLGIDVESVKSALANALRETPAVVVISELREEDDFKAVLEFAATGHLVLATAHNSSLVDAMEKLMRMFKATTPSMRSTLAHRVKALIHLQSTRPVGRTAHERKVTLPALWRANSGGVRTFVCEGLSSILHRTPSADNEAEASTLGYRWTARKVLDELFPPQTRSAHDDDDIADVYQQALKLDLNVR